METESSIFAQINWLAVLVATIAWFLIGAIWYSTLFQKQWVAYHNINITDPELKKGTGMIFFISFVLMFVAVMGMAILIEMMGITSFKGGLKLGLLTGVCFSMTAISITYLYLKKPLGLHFIDGLYHLVGMVIAGIILSQWQ
jgi:hypothetical protein